MRMRTAAQNFFGWTCATWSICRAGIMTVFREQVWWCCSNLVTRSISRVKNIIMSMTMMHLLAQKKQKHSMSCHQKKVKNGLGLCLL